MTEPPPVPADSRASGRRGLRTWTCWWGRDLRAVHVEVARTGWYGAVAAEAGPGKTVAVVGDGGVGLLTILAAKQLGAERIIAMSRHESRQKLAVEFGATDTVTERGDEGVAKVNELLGRHFEVVQFDAHAEAAGYGAHLVTFSPRPEPEVEHDTEPETQNLLGQAPKLLFDLLPSGPVPRRRAQGPLPLVLREAHRSSFRGEASCKRGLARPRQPAGEKESGLAHGVQVNQVPPSGDEQKDDAFDVAARFHGAILGQLP